MHNGNSMSFEQGRLKSRISVRRENNGYLFIDNYLENFFNFSMHEWNINAERKGCDGTAFPDMIRQDLGMHRTRTD